MDLTDSVKSMVTPSSWTRTSYGSRDKECLMRAMFFESNRSSRDGLVAVGTVVMNRLRSGQHGSTICEVVGAKGQFAPGVMTRPMTSSALPDVEAAADAVLKGERHPKVKNAMFFHTAGLRFPYKNMHYTVVAGGNAFYEKRNRRGEPVVLPDEKQPVMFAQADAPPQPVLVAQADTLPGVTPLAMSGPSPSSGQTDIPMPISSPLPVQAPAQPSVAVAVADADGWSTGPSGESPSTEEPAMSFDVDPSDANAIGAMIANEGGGLYTYN